MMQSRSQVPEALDLQRAHDTLPKGLQQVLATMPCRFIQVQGGFAEHPLFSMMAGPTKGSAPYEPAGLPPISLQQASTVRLMV